MKIYKNIDNFKTERSIITVGTFDGVHLGHQSIFKELKDSAKQINAETVVLTFWPHPRMVLAPKGSKIKMINTIAEKIKLIEACEIENLIILPFNLEFSRLTSCQFIEKILHIKLNIKGLIVGYDHHFGRDKEGNYEVLKQCAKQYNFFIKKVDAFSIDNENISSTLIRNNLNQGNIEKVNRYLSRKFVLNGQIIGGQKIGRDLGFPTANILPDEEYKILPKDGVYAVEVELNAVKWHGMLNIGHKPTISSLNNSRTIEVHIINFSENIYHQEIKVFFHKRIRNEQKFKNLKELKQQLINDKKTVSAYFNI